eukprot:6778189-Heterocapsa_arctica.AAC.1
MTFSEPQRRQEGGRLRHDPGGSPATGRPGRAPLHSIPLYYTELSYIIPYYTILYYTILCVGSEHCSERSERVPDSFVFRTFGTSL